MKYFDVYYGYQLVIGIIEKGSICHAERSEESWFKFIRCFASLKMTIKSNQSSAVGIISLPKLENYFSKVSDQPQVLAETNFVLAASCIGITSANFCFSASTSGLVSIG